MLSYSYLQQETRNTYCLFITEGFKESLINYVEDSIKGVNYSFELLLGVARLHPLDKFIKNEGRNIAQRNLKTSFFTYKSHTLIKGYIHVVKLVNEKEYPNIEVQLSYTESSKSVRFVVVYGD